MEAVISPEFMAHGDDKEEIWAGVKASDKCSTASPNVVEMEMSAVFVVRWRPETLAVCQTRSPYDIRSALTADCFISAGMRRAPCQMLLMAALYTFHSGFIKASVWALQTWPSESGFTCLSSRARQLD